MKTTVIICSAGRPLILHETVLGLLKQTVRADSIVLSLCDEGSVFPETLGLPGVRGIFGAKGLTRQRNAAIPHARTPFVLFLDDDVELAHDYTDQMQQVFQADHAIVAGSGAVAADGARDGAGIDRKTAIKAVQEYRGSRACVAVKDLYGCNMFVRSEVLRVERFDERLPLYGWLEDLDFRRRCEKYGKIVRNQAAVIAHLGTRSGRTSDLRYGYAKVANPWYLWRKSVLNSLPEVIVRFWAKTTLANLLRAFSSNGLQGVNYRKRLTGNLMAYRDLILGRIDPLNILKLPDSVEITRPGSWS